MKTKIAQALKTEYANLGLSQKAFDGVAAILEKTVKEETEIDAAIKEASVKELLKLYQKETDSAREERARIQREYEEYKEKHPETTPIQPKPDDKDNPLAKELEALKAKQAEVEAKLKESETKARNAEILTEVHRLMKEKGADNDFIRETTLKGIAIGENDTAESLAEKYQSEYDANFKKAYGEGFIPPRAEPKPTDYKAGAYASEVERLRAEGKLPKTDK